MRRPVTWRTWIVCVLMAAAGCHPTQPFYLREDGDLSHYLDKATQAEHPDVHVAPLAEVAQSRRPLTLTNPEFDNPWDLSLQECVAIALANSKVLRGGQAARLQNGQIFAGTQQGSVILAGAGRGLATAFDPAIVESNPGFTQFNQFGQPTAEGPTVDGGVGGARQGVEAALADFDAQLSISGNPGSVIASSTNRPQNVTPQLLPGGEIFPQTLDLRSGGLRVDLQKRTADGSQFAFRSITDYDRGNQRGAFQALNSFWTQTLEVEARHPLLRGRGAQINRMPIILARIGHDIELMNVLSNLQDTVNNVEVRYWDLYLAYRNLETAKVARDSALVTWRIVDTRFAVGQADAREEAQAREQYFSFLSQVQASLRALYDTENELRLLMGLAATDGRLIRPKDDPTLAAVNFEWTEVLAEAVARRPELLQQRWRIKQREMELILARNRLLPQLDVGAFYRWLGLGDDLIHASRTGVPFPGEGSTAWEELTGGDYQEFGFLFQYSMPIGFRRELAGVRHAQLRLARDKALLEDMELDASHGLTQAWRNIDAHFEQARVNANRWHAAQTEVETVEDLYRGGRATLDLVLEAQRRRALAQAAFWNNVAEYNKAIADFHTRKGSILEYDGIGFEEGPWPQKAYWDALARARERDAGHYIDYGWTRPRVISRGAMPQHGPGHAMALPPDALPYAIEELPAPQPTPAARPPMMEDELPRPRLAPQETRLSPADGAEQISAAAAGAARSDAAVTVGAEVEVASAIAAAAPSQPPPAPAATVRPIPAAASSRPTTADYWQDAGDNPLRGR